MVKRAVCYVRGRMHNGKWAADRAQQLNQFKAYAEEHECEIKARYIEETRFSLKNRTGAHTLAKALDKCKSLKADFLYIDLGRWRRNPVFIDTVSEHKKKDAGPKPYPYRMIAIPAERKTIEAIERQARLEKYEESFRVKKIAARTEQKKFTGLQQFKIDRQISTKRFNNFKHLYAGVLSIYDVILKNINDPSSHIADVLNSKIFLTVDGKRWNRHNAKKTVDLINSTEFEDFVTLCNEEKDLQGY